MVTFDVLTIFPEMVADYKKVSIIARAISKKLLRIREYNLRAYTVDAHQTVDGRPYGGGFGMVLRADIILKALTKIVPARFIKSGAISLRAKARSSDKKTRILLMTPQGKLFNQTHAKRLAKYERLVFVCGRYEGFDERVEKIVDEQFSIGDYILMGGELPALVMIETIARFVTGVVGKSESVANETFSASGKNSKLLEHPQYTRPEILKIGAKNYRVPKVLLSGDHKKVQHWRDAESLRKTKKARPDL